MRAPQSKISILVVEDRQRHFDAIKTTLANITGCVVYRLKSADVDALYNYKSLHPDSHLAVVDLSLRTYVPDKYEGLKVIRFLQCADQTMFYVVFSQYEPPHEMTVEQPGPHWTFVRKQIDGRGISNDSLVRLKETVAKYIEWSSPTLTEPTYEAFHLASEISDHVATDGGLAHRIKAYANGPLVRSTEIMQRLTRLASSYNRAGQATARIGIGVFGSCGRLEMRPDSDIEVAMYYDGAENPGEMRELCAILWNRITRTIANQGWKYEGSKLLKATSKGYLQKEQIPEGIPGQGYVPGIEVNALTTVDFGRHPHARDRHLQVLTEVRPIFNPTFINAFKRAIIENRVRNVTSILALVEQGQYLPDLFEQYRMDTSQARIATCKDVKATVYRLLNVLSTRLWLAAETKADDWQLNTNETWDTFFDALAAPGILKVIRFVNRSGLAAPGANVKSAQKLREKVLLIIQEYAYLLDQLTDLGASPSKPVPDHLRMRVREIILHFVDVFAGMSDVKCFRQAVNRANWLVDVAPLRDLTQVI